MKKLIILLMVVVPFIASSQISDSEKKESIQKILEILENRYIFPEVADSMKNVVISNLESGKYDTISLAEEFAFQLTSDLQQVSKDLHLKIQFEEQREPQPDENEKDDAGEKWIQNLMQENNYGVTSKKILEGNIGYLEIPMFGPLDLCADTLMAAIGFIKNTDALIIDLRECRGSLDENTIPFLCSYFFKEPVHLFDFYTRETNSTKQFWTCAWVPGEKYVEKPIYILTSGRTFSGGEELAYDLKHAERAEIVGETTRGGANPTDYARVNSHFSISVPYMRSINPVTKTNWEQRGVQPDIAVKSNMALYTAHVEALQKLYSLTEDNNRHILLQKTLQQVVANQPQFR
ncbi:MAG: S41 family peptidase, partial [Prolixibacteraceae bacterium]|nr:S41 family peptidase [Prolixibacteraceae bacterium]